MFPNIPPSEVRKHQLSKFTLTLSILATDNIHIRGRHSLGHIACTCSMYMGQLYCNHIGKYEYLIVAHAPFFMTSPKEKWMDTT